MKDRRTPMGWPGFLTLVLVFAFVPRIGFAEPLRFDVQRQVEKEPGSGVYERVTESLTWAPEETAVVICDMWDQHWCRGATARVAEMAPRMNETVRKLRTRGVLIIHAPSNTLEFYKDTHQRRLAAEAPKASTEIPLRNWCGLDETREAPLPIDDSDGGCDCNPTCAQGGPWTRQIATIEILAPDAITDSAEAYYLMRARGIKNVLVMGVHTNMCVLGRPFSIRQMRYQGQNVVLVRDLTDTMYNSRSHPFVSHFEGTDLVVAHIEKYWAPTTTSAAFTGGDAFRFAADQRHGETK